MSTHPGFIRRSNGRTEPMDHKGNNVGRFGGINWSPPKELGKNPLPNYLVLDADGVERANGWTFTDAVELRRELGLRFPSERFQIVNRGLWEQECDAA